MVNERTVFEHLMDLDDPLQRAAYLDEVGNRDARLRSRVEALLQSHEEAGSFLQGAAAAGEVPTLELPMAIRPGTTIGNYRLRELIGEGGFGFVYVAEQQQPVRRTVALKIIKPAMASADVIARFEAERQALAMMDHPNIARVLDAGTTDAGLPYFVMELVRGVTITEFCDQQKLSLEERLKLFADVCRAVQHAHQKGVIHRDLKPSNVMITMHDDRPVAKVIDFGVSKALGQQLTDKTVYTAYGQIVGTPLYMSPEQVQMNELGVDTRSDVYSLGVLLYQLLTGTTPFDRQRLEGAGFDDLRRIVCEEDPLRPSARISTLKAAMVSTIADSRRVDPRKFDQMCRGELDWIVMKALEKDRSRRYESASAFADDVDRYLNDEPVMARPASTWYRFRKFARRRKMAFVISLLLATMCLIAVGSIGWIVNDRMTRQALRTTQVEMALSQARRLMDDQKWTDALAEAKHARTLITVGDVESSLKQQVRRLYNTLKLIEQMEDARLAASERTGANYDYGGSNRAYATAFDEYGVNIEELSPREAAAVLRSQAPVLRPIAAGLDGWAFIKLSQNKSDTSAAEHLVAIANALDDDPLPRRLRNLIGISNTSEKQKALQAILEQTSWEKQPAQTILCLAESLKQAELVDKSIDVARYAQRNHPSDFWLNLWLARTLLKHDPTNVEVLQFYRIAVALRPDSTAVYNGLGEALKSQSKFTQAMEAYRKAIELDPKSAGYINLGMLLYRLGREREAIEVYRKGIKANAAYIGPLHEQLAFALANSNDQSLRDAALDASRNAIRLDPDKAGTYYRLAVLLESQDKFTEAVDAYRKAIQVCPESTNYIKYCSYISLGMMLRYDLKRDREAIEVYRDGIEANLPRVGPLHDQLARALADSKDQSLRDPTQAVMHAQKALELPPGSAGKSYIWVTLGMAHYRAGQWSEAVEALEAAATAGPQTEASGDFFLAMAYWQLGQTEEAHEAYERAVKWTRSHSQQSTYATMRKEVESVLGIIDGGVQPAGSSVKTTEAESTEPTP